MRILVAIEPADFRCGIDGLARLCRTALAENPLSGTVFVFRNRRRTGIRVLVYDGQGFWLCYKRSRRSGMGCLLHVVVRGSNRYHMWIETHQRIV